jgi:hypothetical protein
MVEVGRCSACDTVKKLWNGRGMNIVCRECFERMQA